ncbi:MAG TPA: hypothetical protein DDW68_09990 [Verrucomicrobiales bacterium]|nr:hypothetical protein [Verrucomicrobiales bacterium]
MLQRRSANDRIIKNHQRIPFSHDTIRNVVNVGNQLIAPAFLRNKGPQLNILVSNLLTHGPIAENQIVEPFLREFSPLQGFQNIRTNFFTSIETQAIHQTIISCLRSIGNKGEDRLIKVMSNRLHNLIHESRTHRLALLVDLRIISPREVNLLE